MPNPTPANVEEWLSFIDGDEKRAKAAAVLDWVAQTYPRMECQIKWKQPMFINEGTFIIGFSFSKDNLLVAPDGDLIQRFSEQILAAGYTHGKKMFRIPFAGDVNYELLQAMIETNLKEKEGYTRFWR